MYTAFSATILLTALAMVVLASAPSEAGRIPSRVDMIRRLNYLKKFHPYRFGNTNAAVRKNKFYSKMMSCGPTLERKCKLIASRCHFSILGKRSIPDEENEALSRAKRSASGNGSRRRPKRVRLNINCQMCQRTCWK